MRISIEIIGKYVPVWSVINAAASLSETSKNVYKGKGVYFISEGFFKPKIRRSRRLLNAHDTAPPSDDGQ
jgi:hypothetical protein